MNRHARALRQRMTEAEKLMWGKLRDRRLDGVKFKRQKPIAGYIVDFVALDFKLIVEIDGGQQAERTAEDAIRTKVLEECGYHVVRFWNHDVLGNIEGVLEALIQELNISRDPPHPNPLPAGERGLIATRCRIGAQKKGAHAARPSSKSARLPRARVVFRPDSAAAKEP